MTAHASQGLLVCYGPRGPFYVGLCSCGWRSGRRRSRKIAAQARDTHLTKGGAR